VLIIVLDFRSLRCFRRGSIAMNSSSHNAQPTPVAPAATRRPNWYDENDEDDDPVAGADDGCTLQIHPSLDDLAMDIDSEDESRDESRRKKTKSSVLPAQPPATPKQHQSRPLRLPVTTVSAAQPRPREPSSETSAIGKKSSAPTSNSAKVPNDGHQPPAALYAAVAVNGTNNPSKSSRGSFRRGHRPIPYSPLTKSSPVEHEPSHRAAATAVPSNSLADPRHLSELQAEEQYFDPLSVVQSTSAGRTFTMLLLTHSESRLNYSYAPVSLSERDIVGLSIFTRSLLSKQQLSNLHQHHRSIQQVGGSTTVGLITRKKRPRHVPYDEYQANLNEYIIRDKFFNERNLSRLKRVYITSELGLALKRVANNVFSSLRSSAQAAFYESSGSGRDDSGSDGGLVGVGVGAVAPTVMTHSDDGGCGSDREQPQPQPSPSHSTNHTSHATFANTTSTVVAAPPTSLSSRQSSQTPQAANRPKSIPRSQYSVYEIAESKSILSEAFAALFEYVRGNKINYVGHRFPPKLAWISESFTKYCADRNVKITCVKLDMTVSNIMISEDCFHRENHNSATCEVCLFHSYFNILRRSLNAKEL
jgi:hypothetical protein